MNELASELRVVYEKGMQDGTATVEAVLFGIRRSSDILMLVDFSNGSRTSVIQEIIDLSGVNKNIEPMISLGHNLSSRVRILE